MQPSEQDIRNTLLTYLRTHVLALGVPIADDSDLPALGIDSVTIVELAMHVEERFSLEIPVAQLTPDHTRTVRALSACALQFGKPLS